MKEKATESLKKQEIRETYANLVIQKAYFFPVFGPGGGDHHA